MPTLLKPEPGHLKGQVVGWAGHGKTSLLCSAADVPEMSPVVVLDAEGGLLSVQHRTDVYTERVRNNRHFHEIVGRLATGDKDWVQFKTVIVDSATELVMACLEEIAGEEFKKYKADNSRAKRDSIDDVQLKDYGVLQKTVRRQFRWLKDLDQRHILFSSLPQNLYPQAPSDDKAKREFEEKIKKGLVAPLRVVPAIPQKLGEAILGFTDFNWFLEVTPIKNGDPFVPKMQRRLITQMRPPYFFIKTRGSKFAAGLGTGLDVDEVPGGTPTIKGLPAMQYVWNAYRDSLAC